MGREAAVQDAGVQLEEARAAQAAQAARAGQAQHALKEVCLLVLLTQDVIKRTAHKHDTSVLASFHMCHATVTFIDWLSHP